MAFPPFLLSCTFFSFFLLLSGIFFLFYFAGRLIHPPTAFFFSCFTHLIPFNIPSVSVSIPSILHKIAFFLFSLIEYNSLPHRSLVLPHFSTTCQSDPSFFFKSPPPRLGLIYSHILPFQFQFLRYHCTISLQYLIQHSVPLRLLQSFPVFRCISPSFHIDSFSTLESSFGCRHQSVCLCVSTSFLLTIQLSIPILCQLTDAPSFFCLLYKFNCCLTDFLQI